jgi:MerR family copper efflux transcriptional regulator
LLESFGQVLRPLELPTLGKHAGWRVFALARRGSLSATPAPSLRIGEVARRTGLPVKTIRFYCDEGLLQPKGRSAAGYRLFDEENLAELTIIRALRTMDVSIAELVRILEVRRAGVCNCSVLKGSMAAKVESINLRIAELAAMKDELSRLLDSWQDCGGAKVQD